MKYLKSLVIILLFLSAIACVGNGSKHLSETNEKDGIVYLSVDSCVIFIVPSDRDIEELKSKYEEHVFYTIMDDVNFYTYEAEEYLGSKGIVINRLDSLRKICFNNGEIFDVNNNVWDFILYKKGSKPLVVKAIDIKFEFENYFSNLQTNAKGKILIHSDSIICNNQNENKQVVGKWSTSYENSTILTINNESEFILPVMSNQIYIKAKIKREKDSLCLYLIEPDDLGVGGMQLAWGSFSRDKPIAIIESFSSKLLNLKWIGFYDSSLNAYVFPECEFNLETSSNPSLLKRCN